MYLIFYIPVDKSDAKIDLLDIYGERLQVMQKGDLYANLYLADKQCYELHLVLINKGNLI
jgi:hypothetical protein